ncbi:hypothetical protein MycrhN_0885 [Mycolicibacterium rhodesiae NBB3]|uniref:Uncharacterized protein n=1 Tax=Mycolicibacterium rhodesiae (strain NBB3) TaxID=710685 RepID=G8RRS4_MYCRN|nr:hypothetical protein MycrhN_0885 [Mycolicibacterium rhodesiae NBB3]
MSEIEGLPDEIDSGDIAFTFENYDSDGGGPTLFDFRATWDGGHTMTWWQDISERQPGLSPMSSAPSEGWASWRNGNDLLVAYTWPDLETDGWAYVRGGAPTAAKDDDAMYEPETWLALARTVLGVVHERFSDADGGTFR